MDLCHEPAEWRDWVGQIGLSTLGAATAEPTAVLRSFVASEFGDRALDTHDWAFTPGNGAMLQHLLGSVPPSERGAILPTYQAVAATLLPGQAFTSTVVEPTDWSGARFSPPARAPRVMVVNPMHANPLAVSLPAAFLGDVAGYAQETGALLIEDDAFRGTGVIDDAATMVLIGYPAVYLGSWTKLLGWPVKLGFVGWPRDHPAATRWRASAPTVPAASLSLLTATLVAGATETIRDRRRARLAKRRSDVTALLTDLGIAFLPPTGGAHVAILTEGDDRLRRSLLARGVGGLGWSSFYQPGAPSPTNPFLRLGISNVPEAGWASLISRLAQALTRHSRLEPR